MSDVTLTYGTAVFSVRESANTTWQDLANQIEEAIRAGGSFVDLPIKPDGLVTVLFTAGVPIWFTQEEGRPQFVPYRVR